ncbi:hypothetical protein ACFWMP_16450 [Paenibacillus sp. NPDC058367]
MIDINTVINGSYNRTNRAQYNYENINIITNRGTAEAYTIRFVSYKQS